MITLVKKFNGLHPVYDSDKAALDKIGNGEIVEVSIKKTRNYRFHKKFFALAKLVFDNQDTIKTFDQFMFVWKLKAGHYQEVNTGKGVIYMPKSISFEKMNESEFEEFYNKFALIARAEIGCTNEEIEQELLNFM